MSKLTFRGILSVTQFLLLLFSHWIVSNSFATPWTIGHQALLLIGFPRQYWETGVGCHFLLQGSSKPRDQIHVSCLAGRFFTSEPGWEIDGETVETVSDFIFLGSKITADGDCSHEIKRRLLLGRKVMSNLDSIFKSRDITLPTKV